ncbi:asparagine synthase-related protein [Sphingomicrobium flavum]|uniref:asparagine synthase-related protein n=1 Tax=Sphingomicrobium flavum TaxID=1229164 RepID=UPI0021ADAC13|nr:asparagine synthetase B family protein [Sphingomicrobium flavum]
MAKAVRVAKAEAGRFGPIFERVSDAGHQPLHVDDEWRLTLRRGAHCIILDMAPQAGGVVEAERIFQALLEDRLDDLATSDHRFAALLISPGRIVLARDPLGTRPLHYRIAVDGIAIATMPQDLRRAGDRLDWNWLARRAAMRHRSDRSTAWSDIKRVMPGHVVSIDRSTGAAVSQQYWMPDCDPVERDFETLVTNARTLVRHAVARALEDADGPAAVQLTGGLDSSLVLLSASDGDCQAQLVALTGRHSGPPTKLPGNDFFDDAARAEQTARQLGVDHHVVIADDGPLIDRISAWNRALGEPVANGDNLSWLDPLYAKARTLGARRLLSGGSGNFTTSWPGSGALAEARRSGLFRWWTEMRRRRARTGASWSGMMLMSFPAAHRAWRRWRRPSQAGGNPFVEGPDGDWPIALDPRADRRELVLRYDPGPWNEAVRRRFGIEEIDLFADRRLVEFCLTLQETDCAHDGQPRALGRALLRGRLPDALVDEPARGVQGADWGMRIAAERDQLLVIAEQPFDAGPINRGKLIAAVEAFDPDTAGKDETINRFDLLRTVAALEFARWGE